MFERFLRAVACLTALLFLCTACAGTMRAVNSVVNYYAIQPEYINVVQPWVKSHSDFDAFMTKYQDNQNLTGQDEADIIIQLGFLNYAPSFLTPQALSLIDQYYPGYREQLTESAAPQPVRLAQNEFPRVLTDAEPPDLVVAQAQPLEIPVLLLFEPAAVEALNANNMQSAATALSDVALQEYVSALAALQLLHVAINKLTSDQLLTDDALQQLATAVTQACANPGMQCQEIQDATTTAVPTSDQSEEEDDYCAQARAQALAEAPGNGFIIIPPAKIGDMRYKGGAWAKYAYNLNTPRGLIQVHFMHNVETDEEVDFKISVDQCR